MPLAIGSSTTYLHHQDDFQFCPRTNAIFTFSHFHIFLIVPSYFLLLHQLPKLLLLLRRPVRAIKLKKNGGVGYGLFCF